MKSKYQLFIRNVSFSLDCVPVNCYILSFIIYIKNIVTWPLNDIVFGEFCVCNFWQKQSIMWSNCQKSVRKKIDAEWQSSARFTFLRNRVHCVKCVQIRSFFWSVFSRIRTEYGEIVSLRIQSEYRKKRTRKYSIFGYFSRSGNFYQKYWWQQFCSSNFPSRQNAQDTTSNYSHYYATATAPNHLRRIFLSNLQNLAINYNKLHVTNYNHKIW